MEEDQWISCVAITAGLILLGCFMTVGYLLQFILEKVASSPPVDPLQHITERDYNIMEEWIREYEGIPKVQNPSGVLAEYDTTIVILSSLAAILVLFVSFLVVLISCVMILEIGTFRETQGNEQRRFRSSRSCRQSHQNHSEHVFSTTRTLMSSLMEGLDYMNWVFGIVLVLRSVLNTTKTLIFSLMAGLKNMNHKLGNVLQYIFRISSLMAIFKTMNREVSETATPDTELLRRQLLEANERLSQEMDKSLCIICLDAPREIILKPCKHYCLCSRCLDQLRDCPICKHRIQKTEKIYHA